MSIVFLPFALLAFAIPIMLVIALVVLIVSAVSKGGSRGARAVAVDREIRALEQIWVRLERLDRRINNLETALLERSPAARRM